jgi:preprotein translocase subunit SecG
MEKKKLKQVNFCNSNNYLFTMRHLNTIFFLVITFFLGYINSYASNYYLTPSVFGASKEVPKNNQQINFQENLNYHIHQNTS